jgi:hypothetical protein
MSILENNARGENNPESFHPQITRSARSNSACGMGIQRALAVPRPKALARATE